MIIVRKNKVKWDHFRNISSTEPPNHFIIRLTMLRSGTQKAIMTSHMLHHPRAANQSPKMMKMHISRKIMPTTKQAKVLVPMSTMTPTWKGYDASLISRRAELKAQALHLPLQAKQADSVLRT
jgi:hypothetical protein